MKQLRGVEIKRFMRKVEKSKNEVYLLLEDLQYARNVAAIFRTAEAFKVKKIFLTGVTPTPPFGTTLKKASRSKEMKVYWEYKKTSGEVIQSMKKRNFEILALEITDESVKVDDYDVPPKVLLVAGSEMYGIKPDTLDRCDKSIFIPMYGKGASLNVNVACSIALFNLRSNYEK